MVLSKVEQSIGVFSEGSPGILILYLHRERTCILCKIITIITNNSERKCFDGWMRWFCLRILDSIVNSLNLLCLKIISKVFLFPQL